VWPILLLLGSYSANYCITGACTGQPVMKDFYFRYSSVKVTRVSIFILGSHFVQNVLFFLMWSVSNLYHYCLLSVVEQARPPLVWIPLIGEPQVEDSNNGDVARSKREIARWRDNMRNMSTFSLSACMNMYCLDAKSWMLNFIDCNHTRWIVFHLSMTVGMD
jgi:hypothetical protein